MQKNKFLSYSAALTAFIFFFSSNEGIAQYYHTSGGRLIHVQEALNPSKGTTNLSLIFDYHITPNAYEPGYDGVTFEQGNSPHQIARAFVNFDWSVLDNLTVGLNLALYNTIHHYQRSTQSDRDERKDGVFAESVSFVAKLGSIGFANNYAFFGGMATFSIPLADKSYNSYGNPYTAGGFELGIYLLSTICFDNFFPRESFNISLNAGFYQYFDSGKDISNYGPQALISHNSQSSSINYSVGLSIPVSIVKFVAEVWGWVFLSQPSIYAYTREDMAFITGGAKFNVLSFLNLNVSFDYAIAGNSLDQTTYSDVDKLDALRAKIFKRPGLDPVNYTPWRVSVGVDLVISGSYSLAQYVSRQPPPVDFVAESRNAKVILKKIEEVRLDKLTISERINELRKRRQDIERNLQILKQIIKQTKSSSISEGDIKTPPGQETISSSPPEVTADPNKVDSSSKVTTQDPSAPSVKPNQQLPDDPEIESASEPTENQKIETKVVTTKKVFKKKISVDETQEAPQESPKIEQSPSKTQEASQESPKIEQLPSETQRKTRRRRRKRRTRESRNSRSKSSSDSNDDTEEVITTVKPK